MIGAVLSVATSPVHSLVSKAQSEQLASVLLAVVGAIYIAAFGMIVMWSLRA